MTVRRWSVGRIRLERLVKDVSADERKDAERMASAHGAPVIPGLGFTEARVEWILLRRHATRGQIDPRALRRMRTRDLEYLAGLQLMNPLEAVDQDRTLQEIKVLENGTRATRELAKRATWRATVTGATLGSAVGALVAILGTTW